MSIQDLKIGAWKNPVAAEADRPNRSAGDMKAIFDSNTNELKDAHNSLVDAVELAAETIKNDLPSTQFLRGDGTYGVPEVGEAGNGLPSGGTKGQVLSKASGADYDAKWVDAHRTYNATLLASAWDGVNYTLDVDGATATNIVELDKAPTITLDQLEALQGANIVGIEQAAGSIILKALGDVPKIDIPIIVIVRGDL